MKRTFINSFRAIIFPLVLSLPIFQTACTVKSGDSQPVPQENIQEGKAGPYELAYSADVNGKLNSFKISIQQDGGAVEYFVTPTERTRFQIVSSRTVVKGCDANQVRITHLWLPDAALSPLPIVVKEKVNFEAPATKKSKLMVAFDNLKGCSHIEFTMNVRKIEIPAATPIATPAPKVTPTLTASPTPRPTLVIDGTTGTSRYVSPDTAASTETPLLSIVDIYDRLHSAVPFSKSLAPGKIPKLSTDLSSIRYLGCTGLTSKAYFDLSKSDISTGRFRGIVAWHRGLDSNAQPQRVANQLLAQKSNDTSGETIVTLSSLKRYAPEIHKLIFKISPDLKKTALVATSYNKYGERVLENYMTCEMYSESILPVSQSESVFYECSGEGGMWLQFNRPYKMVPLVGYESEAQVFGNPAAINDYFKSFPVEAVDEKNSKGHSISDLEWMTVGGVLQYNDRVFYNSIKTPQREPEYFFRIFQADWSSLDQAKPTDTLTVTRIENAPWYTMSSSNGRRPLNEFKHDCRRVPNR